MVLRMSKDRDYILRQLFEKLSVKESELLRPIIPVDQWVRDEYYVGKDGLKLYPFWRNVIKDIFESGQQYNQVCLSGGIGCRPLNTKYETSDGYLSLEQISHRLKNKSIFVNTENGKEKIVATHIVGEKELIRLTLSDGVIFEGSSDHLIKVFDGTSILFKKLSDINDKDCVLVSSKERSFVKEAYSLEEAYFVGSVLGDGCIGKDGLEFIWSCENDGSEEIKSIISSLFPDRNIHKYYKPSGFHYYDIRVKDRENITRLFESDYSTAYTKHIPSWVFSSSNRIIWSFVAGLFDTDGFIDKRGIIQITSASEKLIRGLHTLLLILGVTSSIQKTRKKCGSFEGHYYIITITQHRSKLLFKKNCPLRWVYKKSRINDIEDTPNRNCKMTLHGISKYMADTKPKLVIPRKLDSFKRYRYKKQEITLETILRMNDYYPDWVNTSDVLSYIINNRCYFIKVKQKENLGLCLVGDIEVEGSHTYISDGIINHNTGKSTCAVFILVRKLYEISCYSNIQGKFHLMNSALIVFLYFSLSKFQAKRTGFKQFKDTIDSIPYFLEHFPRDPKANDELRFPSNVYYFYGTGTGDAIGANVLASILDEANFFSDSGGDGSDYKEVADLHRALIARQESRFLRNGKNESLSVVVSSNTFKSSYTEELKKRSLTDPSIKCYRARSWDIKPKGTYSDIFFYVFCGTDKVDPFVIDSPMDLISKLNLSLDPNQTVKEAVSKLPNDLRTLVDEVPVDFKNQYIVNIVKALQDFSGFSVESTNTFFNNRNVFNSCIDDSIPSLFTKTEFVIETQNDSPQNSIMFYLSGRQFPNPDKPRFIHVDLGLSTDACGISCCYKSGVKMVDGVEHATYSYDFSIRIVPPPAPKKISIARTEEFLIYLRDKLHLTIGMISWDQFQSSSSQQRLQELGFPVRYQSVDRTDKAYLYFSECLYLNCVTFNSQFSDDIQHELFNLIHYRDKHKVDHPSDTKHGGMKDRMDAIVGSLYNALECVPQEVNYNDTYALSYLNSDNDAPFTEESSWLFDQDSRAEQIKEIIDQEYKNMMKNRL